MSYRFDCDAPNWPKGLNQMTSRRTKKTHGPVSRLFLQLWVYTVYANIYIYISIYFIYRHILESLSCSVPSRPSNSRCFDFSGFGSLQKRQVKLRRLPLSHVLGFSLDKMRIC